MQLTVSLRTEISQLIANLNRIRQQGNKGSSDEA